MLLLKQIIVSDVSVKTFTSYGILHIAKNDNVIQTNHMIVVKDFI